jgi:hypothetical protein
VAWSSGPGEALDVVVERGGVRSPVSVALDFRPAA